MRLRRALAWALGSALVLWLGLRFSPLPVAALDKDYSTAYLDAQGRLLRLRLSPSGRYRMRLGLGEISPKVVQGFLAYEDRWFWWHPGINPGAAFRAAAQNLASGRRRSGASTLTMQVAKIMAPRPRTWGAKLRESLRALQLEARYSKTEILERYLNSVPMGGNIQGVGAAAWLYFGKPAARLSLGEAALLVSLPRSPSARRPDRHPWAARQGRDRVLRRILPQWSLSEAEAQAAFAAEIPQHRFANPNIAPQYIQRLGRSLAPGQVWRLAMEGGLQGLCERQLSTAVRRLRPQGVHNGALLLIDNRSQRVLAYVGSPDPSDPRGGQINGADILRSPGSSLKPFLYALALQKGLITPRGRLADIPRDYAGFKPVDYEGRYEGMLPVEECLARSLNVPAAGLEAALQGEGLENWLHGLGAVTRGRQGMDPGLSVVLGAWPVTLEENLAWYSALAEGGRLRPLRFLGEEQDPGPPAEGRAVLSPEACYLVAEMMAKVERPDLPSTWEFSPTRAKIAFKTGTSYGFRDAWALGFTPEFTCGVWLGNADARGASPLRGASAAAPVLIGVLNAITRHRDVWFDRPPGLTRRRVCSLSGQVAGPECPATEEDDAIPGVSDALPCRVHRKLWIRKSDGKEVCLHCMHGPASAYVEKVFALWPPDVTRYLRSSGRAYDLVPPHNGACAAFPQQAPPHITNPTALHDYQAHRGPSLASQRIPLTCEAGPDTREVYWFVNDTLVFQGPPDRIFYWPLREGRQSISVVDDRGRADKVKIRVLAAEKED